MRKILPLVIVALCAVQSPLPAQPDPALISLLEKTKAFADSHQYDSLGYYLLKSQDLLFSVENRTIAQPYLEQFQELLEQEEQAGALADLHRVLHSIKLNTGKYDESLPELDKSIRLLESVPHPDTIKIAMILSKYCETYFRKGDFGKASHYAGKGIQLLRHHGDAVNMAMYNLCYFSGIIAAETGHLKEALDWMSQSRAVALDLYGDQHPTYATGLLSLGNIHALKGEHEEALQYYHEALDNFIRIAGTDHPDIGFYWANMARANAKLKQYDEAELFFEKALAVEILTFGPNHPYIAFTQSNIGRNYLEQGKLNQAAAYFEKSIALFLLTMGDKNAYIPEVYNNLGEVYLQKKQWDLAIDQFQNAITSNTGITLNDSLDTSSPSAYFHPVQLIRSLLLNSQCHIARFKSGGDANDLQNALTLYEKGDALIDKLQQSHIDQQDLIIFNQVAGDFHTSAINACYILYQQNGDVKALERGFQYAEKNKSIALLKAVKRMQALKFTGIADSLLEKENYLKKKLAKLEGQLIDPQFTANSKAINEDYTTIKNEYAELIRLIEKEYPKYYELKYRSSVINIPEAQQYLQESNTAIIEYAIGADDLFIFLITPDDFQIWKKQVHDLSLMISTFRDNHFSEKALVGSSPDAYADAANELYQILLSQPLEKLKNDDIKNLIIVPDGPLAYLPFDVLVEKLPDPEDNNDFSSLPYLLARYNCSYAWSVTLLQNQSIISRKTFADNYAGFAPLYDAETARLLDSLDAAAQNVSIATRSGWNDLPAARESVRNIAALLKGRSFLFEEADKINFKSNIATARILHLAMHGFLDDNDPLFSGLAFGSNGEAPDDNLYAWELYNMDINSQLAVLSACQTGLGELKKGEGMMSLSRAFTYAGCPAVIMSLWNIPDEASASIIVDFHKALKTGAAKHEALRAAKWNYLKNSQLPPDRLHPFFWAGFIHTGDPAAIDLEKQFPGIYWIGGFLALAIIIVIIRKGRKKDPGNQ